MNWETFGHEQIKQILEKQLKAGSFPHTYLFEGPAKVGKKMLAMEFAARILETKNLITHPDFIILETEGEIKIAHAREFITKLAVKPFAASYKLAVVNNADRLNTESANALLKTLEEPSPSTIIILISKNRQLPKTLLSRCQVLNFNGFTESEMRAFASQKDINVTEEALKLSQGAPGILLELTANPGKAKQEMAKLKRYEEIRKSGMAQRILAVKEFAELEAEELHDLFTEWLAAERVRLRQEITAAKSLNALTSALADLNTNKNKQLILQSLFLKI